jgi:hypothetical protein
VSVYLYCGASEEVQLLQFFLKRFLTSRIVFAYGLEAIANSSMLCMMIMGLEALIDGLAAIYPESPMFR